MAKKIYQYRYYNDNDIKNRPNFNDKTIPITRTNLINGGIFVNKMPIIQLGVQAPPGTKFYLNNGLDPVIIGTTGVFELDLQDGAKITSMRFAPESIDYIVNTDTLFLMIDILYEED